MMQRARHDIGLAKRLSAESFGEPGKRTFRIVAEAERGTALIWMEKQQLSALAISIKTHLEQLATESTRPGEPAQTSSPEPSFDFKVASLAMAYDESSQRVGILAADVDDAESETVTVACWASQGQASTMADEALEIVAAGRPPCPLCHGPLDAEGHVCPMQNGHRAYEEEV
jgi:uncharacterized repeat protein (TIGR03847 family)